MTARPYYHATERCACGATIDVEAYTTDDLRQSLAAFRDGHVHQSMLSRIFGTTDDLPFICTCRTDDEPGLIIDPDCPIHADGHKCDTEQCCTRCGRHTTPHRGCILR